MAQVNHPSNLVDRLVRLERELAEVRKKVGLSSATINRGGLTLLNDSFIRMVDDNDTSILYAGPDDDGRQQFELRREGGTAILLTQGSDQWGRDYWSLWDSNGNVVMSDDAETGLGLARPWMPLPLYRQFKPSGTDGAPYSYATVDAGNISSETALWQGRATITHPWITIDGTWGRGSGDATPTYRLKVNGTIVGEWTETSLITAQRGRFDVQQWVLSDWQQVELTASATGTGAVACHVLGCYLL